MEDKEIIELFFRRDARAPEEVQRKYGTKCKHVAYGMLRSREDAEECVNDAYMVLWEKIPPRNPASLWAYLRKVVRILALKKLEKDASSKRKYGEFVQLSEIEDIIHDNRIKEEADVRELGELIGEFLRQEKPEARMIFVRRYWYCESADEIMQHMACTRSKVDVSLYRTRKRLRAFLRKEGIVV